MINIVLDGNREYYGADGDEGEGGSLNDMDVNGTQS